MATITFKGDMTHTIGTLPPIGSNIPYFSLVKTDLTDVGPDSFKGKRLVLNIFPSIDTGVCALSVRRFNKEASSLNDTIVLCISMDLPFAHSRFCGSEGLNEVVMLSAFRKKEFGTDFGVEIIDGPLAGLLSRAIVVTDKQGVIRYTEQVPEIAQEPKYDAVLKILQ